MGNRAVITTKEKEIGIYLHWNGGRASIEGFLQVCEEMGFRPPSQDDYGWARLAEVCCVFMGNDGLSVGVNLYKNLDTNNGDNGVYIIDGWKIVGREYNPGTEEIDEEKTKIIKGKCLELLKKMEN